MKPNIVALQAPVNAEVVAKLEAALERAKAGETTGILVMEQDASGTSYCIVGIKDRFSKLGILSHAMHRLQSDDT